MICEPLKCTGTRFSEAACRGSSATRTGLPGTTYQQVQGNWYISVAQIHTRQHTARPSRDSNRDLVQVLGVAALIFHSRQINLIFQYLPVHDLVLHDLIGCARADVAGMIFVHLPRIPKKAVGSPPAFAVCVWSTMYNYCVHKCVQTHAPTVTSGMCGNITGETC